VQSIFSISALAMALALQGCPSGSGVTCPPLKQYTAEFQDKLAKETEAIIETSPHVVKALADYGLTRDAIRACIKKRKKK
jgi:hypothetical protein